MTNGHTKSELIHSDTASNVQESIKQSTKEVVKSSRRALRDRHNRLSSILDLSIIDYFILGRWSITGSRVSRVDPSSSTASVLILFKPLPNRDTF